MPINVKKLSYKYSPKTPFEKQALFDIDLNIEEGDFFGIIGATGSGKSTLISHFNALIRINKKTGSGTVIVEGMDLSQKKIDYLRLRSTVGMVFQYPEYQLFDESIFRDIAFGPKNIGIEADELTERVKNAMELVGLDYEEFKDRSPFELSGGQKRRAAIAGVIAMKPKILILDEPTAGLDPKGKKDILEMINTIKSTCCPTIIMISHNMDEIAANCNKIAVLGGGTLMGVFTPKQLFGQKELIESMDLELPEIAQIAYELRQCGIDIDPQTLSAEELITQILKAKGEVGTAAR